MPIVDKINALTGKSAETIEDAIANIDIDGGSPTLEIVSLGKITGGFGLVSGYGENYKKLQGGKSASEGEPTFKEILNGRQVIALKAVPTAYANSQHAPVVPSIVTYRTLMLAFYPNKTVVGHYISDDIKFASWSDEDLLDTKTASADLFYYLSCSNYSDIYVSEAEIYALVMGDPDVSLNPGEFIINPHSNVKPQ